MQSSSSRCRSPDMASIPGYWVGTEGPHHSANSDCASGLPWPTLQTVKCRLERLIKQMIDEGESESFSLLPSLWLPVLTCSNKDWKRFAQRFPRLLNYYLSPPAPPFDNLPYHLLSGALLPAMAMLFRQTRSGIRFAILNQNHDDQPCPDLQISKIGAIKWYNFVKFYYGAPHGTNIEEG